MPDLRPGNRGIGVSVAVAHKSVRGFLVIREVISSISVWDTAKRCAITLQPGTLLRSCQIRRHTHSDVDPYMMEFEAAGGHYECTLVTFQPRTRAAEAVEGATRAG
jgi:hypothetical protein